MQQSPPDSATAKLVVCEGTLFYKKKVFICALAACSYVRIRSYVPSSVYTYSVAILSCDNSVKYSRLYHSRLSQVSLFIYLL